jgi:probable LLM family oxidoreductase
MELGIYSFADVTPDPHSGAPADPGQRLREIVAEVEMAEQVGLDIYGLGEHHRPEYAASAPAVVLAAAAARTERIRLTSAVTVLSSDDPVRVFQDFATLDLLSEGRAEIIAGRGSFIESFPLFGYELADYDELFAEKLDLLLRIRADEHVTWSGRHRAPINGLGVYPRPRQALLPVWVGVGGTPASSVRAGTLGLPMALAFIGGAITFLASPVHTYREAARRAGHDPATLPISINSHGYIADSLEQAIDESFPYYEPVMRKIGNERGFAPPTRERYLADASRRGALMAGSPEQVADKILTQHQLVGHQRFMLQISVGTMPHAQVLRAIERFGREVAPVVREEVSRREAAGFTPLVDTMVAS